MGGGGPSNFIVNQSPNLWTQEFEYFDLDFGLDKCHKELIHLRVGECGGGLIFLITSWFKFHK